MTYRPPLGGPVAALSSPARPAPGVLAVVVAGRPPDLFLRDAGRRLVTVLGRDGEPFAQLGPNGVRVNLRSPVHAFDAAQRRAAPGASTNARARPLWRHVSDQPGLDWFDPRVAYSGGDPRLPVLEAPRPTVLRRLTIPVRIGGRRTELAGTISWVPAPGAAAELQALDARTPGRGATGGAGTSPWWWGGPAIAVGLAALTAGGLVTRRRRLIR